LVSRGFWFFAIETISVVSIVLGYRAWTGLWRAWAVTPLQTIMGLGVLLGIALQMIAISVLTDILWLGRIGLGLLAAGLVLGLWQPRWAKPPWLRGYDDAVHTKGPPRPT
jgi:predicted acyltransferase